MRRKANDDRIRQLGLELMNRPFTLLKDLSMHYGGGPLGKGPTRTDVDLPAGTELWLEDNKGLKSAFLFMLPSSDALATERIRIPMKRNLEELFAEGAQLREYRELLDKAPATIATIASKLLDKGETKLAQEVLALEKQGEGENLGDDWIFFRGYDLGEVDHFLKGKDVDFLVNGPNFFVTTAGRRRRSNIGDISWSYGPQADQLRDEASQKSRQHYEIIPTKSDDDMYDWDLSNPEDIDL